MDQEKSIKYNRIGIKTIGIVLIILAALTLLGGLASGNIVGIIQGTLIILMGILLVLLKRWGLYIMGLIFFGTLMQLPRHISQGFDLLEIATIVIIAILFVYVWSQRKILS